MTRHIINIPMDQLPHASSSSGSSASGSSMPRHTTTMINLSSASRTSSSASSPSTSRPAKPPRRPSLCHRGSFHSTYSQLVPSIARVQAQPHKPKRPSPLHISTFPESSDTETETELLRTDSGSSSDSSSSSIGASSPDLCLVEDIKDDKRGLSPITEEKNVNMLGLKLDGPGSGWNWDWKMEEALRSLEPKTPFPSPSICA